jgi:molybdate transport system substrate-binding protein
MPLFRTITQIFILLLLAGTSPAQAGEVRAAVAANFTAAMTEIAAQFEQASGHRLIASYASTGKLYAQIANGAPFDVFLAADQRRPQLLEEKHVADGRFTYAIGKLVLWSSDSGRQVNSTSLAQADFNKLAIANPKTAPYGAAAVEVLRKLGVYETLGNRLIKGDSIAQTHQFVATGNAELGLVALAQIALDDSGSRWVVDESLYTPLRQDAVLLARGRYNDAALALLDYLRSDAAKAITHKYGYGTE